MKKFLQFQLHLVLQVQIQRIESDRHNKIPRYVSKSFKFFYHLTKSIHAEAAEDTKEEVVVETEVGTTIMEVDIEVDTMDMDVVGTADEAVDMADMEVIVVGHIAGITGPDLAKMQQVTLHHFACSIFNTTLPRKCDSVLPVPPQDVLIQILEGVMVIIIVIIVTSRTEQNSTAKNTFLQIMNS